MSPSTWGCGLKLCRPLEKTSYWSHPLREGVDWNRLWTCRCYWYHSHPLREGVDWNSWLDCRKGTAYRHPLREGVDWNKFVASKEDGSLMSPSTWGCGLKQICTTDGGGKLSHPLREGVDWNSFIFLHLNIRHVTLYVRVWIETNWSYAGPGNCRVTLYVRVWIETAW